MLQIETEQKENLKLTTQKKTFNLRMFLLQKKKKKGDGRNHHRDLGKAWSTTATQTAPLVWAPAVDIWIRHPDAWSQPREGKGSRPPAALAASGG